MMRGHHINLGNGQGFLAQYSRMKSIDHQLFGRLFLDERGNDTGPQDRGFEFIAGFPTQDGLVLPIWHAGNGVGAINDIRDYFRKICNDLGIGPEILFGLPWNRVYSAMPPHQLQLSTNGIITRTPVLLATAKPGPGP